MMGFLRTMAATYTSCSILLIHVLLLEPAVSTMGFATPFYPSTGASVSSSFVTSSNTNRGHGMITTISSRRSIRNTQLQMSSRPGRFRSMISSILRPSKKVTAIAIEEDISSVDRNIPKISVKPRPLVSMDESTGRYIPQPPQPPQLNVNGQKHSTTTTTTTTTPAERMNDLSYEQQFSGWDSFKDLVYDTIDTATFIPKLIGKAINRNKLTTSRRNLAVGYSDTVEFKPQLATNFRASILADDGNDDYLYGKRATAPSTSRPVGKGPAAQIVRQYESSLSASSKDRSDGEDLYRSKSREKFDTAKDGIYDLFTGKKSQPKQQSKSIAGKKQSPLLNNISISTPSTESSSSSSSGFYGSDSADFKSMSKPSTNKDETLINITPYLADLNSSNPIKVLKAKIAIASEERKKKRRIQEQKTRETIDGYRKTAFDIVDAIQNFYNIILSLPKQVEESIASAENALEQTVDQTKKTAKEVRAIPSKVQLAVEDTKQSVKNTKQATIEAVEEVKSIPQKIEKRVADTKQSIKETKEGVEDFVQKVDSFAFEVKVIAGLEKPKPKPPPPPPPPKTNKEIALEVAGVVAKTTGKAAVQTAVVVGKGTIGLTTSAAKVAYNVATAERVEKKENKPSLLSRVAKTVKPQRKEEEVEHMNSNIETTVTIGEIDPLLEREVTDALRSAEEALDTISKEKENPSSDLTSLQINEALLKAKTAAAEARRDAEELQSMLEKRKDYFSK